MVAYLPTHTPIHYVQVVVHGARARAPSLSYTPMYEYKRNGRAWEGKRKEDEETERDKACCCASVSIDAWKRS